ncbi:hypothetical protein A3A38_01410 [Candidatus Kaiserbacteria bacterium RIFCSPLOWO2_01_FULL_53_17]|uniref:DUF4258 domain-containing protein n=1 Tax=Candidatus Kaiserbacteria bacterium RIFCSPLOWO2_01_FULL_53_17 TaxID=1798511 RepID=A0A1F6EI48_9BACT|nr:MAG: hypothetical protein A3A38_01410 [Candidatus Kaiserbacteria bacterium RIFCSPLOWO2_01_FULL_53_17]
MHRFDSPFGSVVLTRERKRHILIFHPDVASCLRYFSETLAAPERTIRSAYDPTVMICYRFLRRRRKYLAIVVKTGPHPFILTAYLAKKVKKDII